MNKSEAIKLMIDGKKVSNNIWVEDCYLYIKDDVFKDDGGSSYDINKTPKDGWKLYEEPKKKVTMYKWAYFNRIDKIWIEVTPFFETEKEFMRYIWEENLVVKRLDYTATEFEAIEQ